MSTKLDQIIEESKLELSKMQEHYNENILQLQQLQAENQELGRRGTELAARINAMEELRAHGASIFQNAVMELNVGEA